MVYVIIIALVLYAFIVAGMWKIFKKAGVNELAGVGFIIRYISHIVCSYNMQL